MNDTQSPSSTEVSTHSFLERRADGWPLCPGCGLDEVYATRPFTIGALEPVPGLPHYTCLDDVLRRAELACYVCGWRREPAVPTVCSANKGEPPSS